MTLFISSEAKNRPGLQLFRNIESIRVLSVYAYQASFPYPQNGNAMLTSVTLLSLAVVFSSSTDAFGKAKRKPSKDCGFG